MGPAGMEGNDGVEGASSSVLPTLLEPRLPAKLLEALMVCAAAGSPGRAEAILTWMVDVIFTKKKKKTSHTQTHTWSYKIFEKQYKVSWFLQLVQHFSQPVGDCIMYGCPK